MVLSTDNTRYIGEGHMSKETFEEWRDKDFEVNGYYDRDEYAEKTWNHQQKEIDRLRKSFTISVTKACKCENNIAVNMEIVERNLELRERVKELEFRNKRLEKQLDVTISDARPRNERILELEGEVKALKKAYCGEDIIIEDLAAQIELLTKCEDVKLCGINFPTGTWVCQGCKNKTLLEKDKV